MADILHEEIFSSFRVQTYPKSIGIGSGGGGGGGQGARETHCLHNELHCSIAVL